MNKIKRALRRFWYKIQVRAYTAVWGERSSWYDYPPERWWQRHRLIRYTIKWRLGQLGNFVFSLLVATAAGALIVSLVGIYLVTTPATAWVNFEREGAEITLNVIYKNSTLPGDLMHAPAAICCTVRSEGGGIPLEMFTCKDVRGYFLPLGYFHIPAEVRERVITVSVELVSDVDAGGRVIEIVPSTRLMGVSSEGWEIVH